jgi:hypothetical protein
MNKTYPLKLGYVGVVLRGILTVIFYSKGIKDIEEKKTIQ